MKILRHLWTKEDTEEEDRNSYQYVIELRERMENALGNATEELKRVQSRHKTYYDQKSRKGVFAEGDQVIILLPTSSNKLLMM